MRIKGRHIALARCGSEVHIIATGSCLLLEFGLSLAAAMAGNEVSEAENIWMSYILVGFEESSIR